MVPFSETTPRSSDQPSSPAPRVRPPYPLIVAAGFALVILAAVTRLGFQSSVSAEPLRRFHSVPPFSLTERSGKTITNADLHGKIWIADFIFTTCPGPCPIISANFARLQSAFASDPSVRLVSFTVDPDDDTPPVLATYADRFHADKDRWLFLTGPEAPLHKLISDGFAQVVSDNRGQPLQPGQFLFTHSTQVVLVDNEGVIRGYFDGIDADHTLAGDLKGAVKQLENE